MDDQKDIPIEFDYKGKHYAGVFTPVSGAANKAYHLMIDNRYHGKLSRVEKIEKPGHPRDPSQIKYTWRFTSQTGEFEELSDFFADVISKYSL